MISKKECWVLKTYRMGRKVKGGQTGAVKHMAKPTLDKAFEMKSRRLIKEIWERYLNCSKDDLRHVSLGKQFMNIKVGGAGKIETNIHRSLLEDYFNSKNKESRQTARERIEKYLKGLIGGEVRS